MAFSSC